MFSARRVFTARVLVAVSFLTIVGLLPMTATSETTIGEIEGGVEFFAHMPFRETAFADLRGIYSITKQRSEIYKHYRFVYDEKGRPVEVSFRMREAIIPLNISRNAVTFVPLTRIEYTEGREIRTFFDRFMNPTTSNGAFKEVFSLDGDGQRQTLYFFDADGERVASDWGIYRYEWSTDKRGTVTENRFDREGNSMPIRPHFFFYCLKLHYDQRGLLALMENYGERCERLTLNGQNGAQDKIQYNARGGAYAWNVYNENEERSVGNGPMVARGIMERDEMGHTIREYYEDTDGNLMTNAYGWTDTHATFDEFGNMISRFNHDRSGARANNPDLGYSGYVMEYDPSGVNRIKLTYFDAAGHATIHAKRGYHSAKSEYDDDGNRTRVTYLDVNGNLVNRLDNCAAMVVYTYDASNQQTSMQRLDRAGNSVPRCE